MIDVETWRLEVFGPGLRGHADAEHAVPFTCAAASLMVEGLDERPRQRGVRAGGFRRSLPVASALDDVLVAYERNRKRLSPAHGFPAALIVPGSEAHSVKWLDRIEVSDRPAATVYDLLAKLPA